MMFVNGMCVVSEMNMVVEIVIVGVWIDVGSRFELVEINGIVYFLEYMFFKGMENRSIWQLEEEIENMGGYLNVYMLCEQMMYYVKVLKKNVNNVVEILFDILQNLIFDEGWINRECDVILCEMEEVCQVLFL